MVSCPSWEELWSLGAATPGSLQLLLTMTLLKQRAMTRVLLQSAQDSSVWLGFL
jgi:hypothetical protein